MTKGARTCSKGVSLATQGGSERMQGGLCARALAAWIDRRERAGGARGCDTARTLSESRAAPPVAAAAVA